MATAGQGRLKCNYVVHAVGPMWCLYDDKQRCAKALRRTFMNALYYANNKLKATSIVLPAIGTGAYVRAHAQLVRVAFGNLITWVVMFSMV